MTKGIPAREAIREIWRPLYALGYKGAEQIDAQYMALLVSQAVDETQALIATAVREARIKEIDVLDKLELLDAREFPRLEKHLAELKKAGQQNAK